MSEDIGKITLRRPCPIYREPIVYSCPKCTKEINPSEFCPIRKFNDDGKIGEGIGEKLVSIFKSAFMWALSCMGNIFNYSFTQSINHFIQNSTRTNIFVHNTFITNHQDDELFGSNVININNDKQKAQKTCKVVRFLRRNSYEGNSTTSHTNSSREIDYRVQTQTSSRTKTRRSLFALITRRKFRSSHIQITNETLAYNNINFDSDSGDSSKHSSELSFNPLLQFSESYNGPSNGTLKDEKCNFIQKIIRRTQSEDNSTNKSSKANLSDSSSNFTFHSNYIPQFEAKFANAIKILQDLIANFHRSEDHMVSVLKKYIGDNNFHQELLKTCWEYFNNQNESKSEAALLINDMWLNQLELYKNREQDLQKRVDFVVKHNRQLQNQIDELYRNCEKVTMKGDFFPRRFFQMRSFGKTFSKQLVQNNRKLQNRVKIMTKIVEGLEEELASFQNQLATLNEDKNLFKSQVFKLKGSMEQSAIDFDLERTSLQGKIKGQADLITNCERAIKTMFGDFEAFQRQIEGTPFTITWPEDREGNRGEFPLIDFVDEIKICIQDLVKCLITAHTNAALIAKDLSKLRETNRRLQENLRKSTNELDLLSRQLESSSREDLQNTVLYSKCIGIEQFSKKINEELKQRNEDCENLTKELEKTKRDLEIANEINNQTLEQRHSLEYQTENLLSQIFQTRKDSLMNVKSFDEKLEYFRSQYLKVSSENKQLKSQQGDVENLNESLVKDINDLENQLSTLQENLDFVNAENSVLRNQIEAEHHTVSTLQEERIKYLEEKNILRTIFQHLKAEISRIQELEGTIVNMTQETSRLALIAEYNKQLGEKLKSEVEIKDNTIAQLQSNVEELNSMQINNAQDKLSLCAELSEISKWKQRLNDCLEMEVERNHQLDETKKKIEDDTKYKMKILEEMQKNERAALRTLLKDYKSVVKQRDSLIKSQEQLHKENLKLKGKIGGIMKENTQLCVDIKDRDTEILILRERNKHRTGNDFRASEEEFDPAKYQRNIRHLEKLAKQAKKEKEDLEISVDYLKNTTQKLRYELDDAREKEKKIGDMLTTKSSEKGFLEQNLEKFKSELQSISQISEKYKSEIDYLKQFLDTQSQEYQNMVAHYKTTENIQNSDLEKTKCLVKQKEEELERINKLLSCKDTEIGKLRAECNNLKQIFEEQNGIIAHYQKDVSILSDAERSKFELQEDLRRLHLDYNSCVAKLDKSQKQLEDLSREFNKLVIESTQDRAVYQNQTEQLFADYQEQKANIEREIGDIKGELTEVYDNLNNEKNRYDHLFQAHDDLKTQFIETKTDLNRECALHQEIKVELAKFKDYVANLEKERDELQRQVHSIIVNLNEEKENNIFLTNENAKFNAIMEECRRQYQMLQSKTASLENQLKNKQLELQNYEQATNANRSDFQNMELTLNEKCNELQSALVTVTTLKLELEETQIVLNELKDDLFQAQEQITTLEFRNCELKLQLHESQGKLKTEKSVRAGLKMDNQKSLEELLKKQGEVPQLPSDEYPSNSV